MDIQKMATYGTAATTTTTIPPPTQGNPPDGSGGATGNSAGISIAVYVSCIV